MKLSFKGDLYISIYAYLRNYHRLKAVVMQKESGDSITSIAGSLRYDNPSKVFFSL